MQASVSMDNKALLGQVIKQHRVLLLKMIIHMLSFLPLIILYYFAFNDLLGADPVKDIIHFTGIGAFNLLLLSLVITPVAKQFRQSYLLQTRRLIGLYSGVYALLHLLNFLAFEVQFDLSLFVSEIFERPYITVGMAALVILVALMITSISLLKRKMGKRWQQLHNLVYLALLLTGLHYFWSVKSDIVEPAIYIILSIALLSLRKDKFKRWLK